MVGRLLNSGTDTTSFSLCFLNISNVCYDFFLSLLKAVLNSELH